MSFEHELKSIFLGNKNKIIFYPLKFIENFFLNSPDTWLKDSKNSKKYFAIYVFAVLFWNIEKFYNLVIFESDLRIYKYLVFVW